MWTSDAPVEHVEPARVQPAPAPPAPVQVRVFSDVPDGELIVNAESKGPLKGGAPLSLRLTPGAYRFEAQSHGLSAVMEAVNVRPDAPLDVHLDLPKEHPVTLTPRVTTEAPRLTTERPGSLSKEVIRRIIGRHVDQVRSCYEQQLIDHPDLQGTTVSWRTSWPSVGSTAITPTTPRV